jgi:hypothetical protein
MSHFHYRECCSEAPENTQKHLFVTVQNSKLLLNSTKLFHMRHFRCTAQKRKELQRTHHGPAHVCFAFRRNYATDMKLGYC